MRMPTATGEAAHAVLLARPDASAAEPAMPVPIKRRREIVI
jgi:hypothetical protein